MQRNRENLPLVQYHRPRRRLDLLPRRRLVVAGTGLPVVGRSMSWVNYAEHIQIIIMFNCKHFLHVYYL